MFSYSIPALGSRWLFSFSLCIPNVMMPRSIFHGTLHRCTSDGAQKIDYVYSSAAQHKILILQRKEAVGIIVF